MRTWTASIDIYTGSRRTTFAAADSEYDLLRDQINVAVREAALFVDEASQINVTIWKNTQARGLEQDRHFTVCRDKRGVVRYQ